MPNPKITNLIEDFTGGVINPAVWTTISGTVTLDTANDQVSIAVPTTSGGIATLGEGTLYDATGSSVYAQVTAAANGAGNTRSIMRVRLDANNAMTVRVEAGVFKQSLVTGGVTTSVTLPPYDAQAHRWWRLREAAGVFFADASPDGLNWTGLSSMAYTWDATAVTLRFESQAGATEVAGSATIVSRINTRAAGPFNENWPNVEHGAGLAWGANGGTSPLDVYVDVSGRTQGTTTITRGRQYELDQVRAGEESTPLSNKDDVLNPVSAVSPLAGRMQPCQPYRIRAQWPATVNLLSPGIAAAGSFGAAPLGTISPTAALDLASDTDTTGGSVVAAAAAWIGTTATAFSVPSGAAAAQRIVHSAQAAVIPGAPYSITVHVRDVTASTSLQVKPFLGWITAGSMAPSSYTYGTTTTLTGSATAGWSTLTVSGTAPAGALGMDVGVAVAATAAATCTVQIDGWQLEHGLVASPWVMPGTWYPMAAQFTEDWQSQWDMSGTYGIVTPAASDALGLLSQQQLLDPVTMEIKTRSARFFYTLGDPDGSTMFTDTVGACRPLTIGSAKAGAGTVTAGVAVTAATPAGIYSGSTGTVVTLTNPSPGLLVSAAGSFLSLAAAGITGPATANWTRMVAFRTTVLPTNQATVWGWSAASGQMMLVSSMAANITSTGAVAFTIVSPSGTETITSAATNAADGNWHLITVGVNAATNTQSLSLDGVLTSRTMSAVPDPSQRVVVDAIGTRTNSLHVQFANVSGDLALAAEIAAVLSPADVSSLYTAWRMAAAGESSGARYARILRYAAYTGPTSIQTGLTTSMGAATGGQDAVTALNDTATTENGSHFIAADGTPTFLSRGARYDAFTPAVTFGEDEEAGEWPYEDVKTTWDSTHLGNPVTVTQTGTGQQFYAQDDDSITAYFARTMTRSVNTSSALEAQDATNYLLSRYRQPLNRVATLVLHPAANPRMWPVCLGLELSTRARVMRRPNGAPAATQIECFIENIAWAMTDGNDATQTLQGSPADLTQYAIFASWHSTLNAGIASGVSTITVTASADTTQPLALQMPRGQSLILGEGTANQETVTVLTVGATSPGWTTAAIALTAATTKSHSAGDPVCEPLPAGVTDPTTYDPASRFDAVAFAY